MARADPKTLTGAWFSQIFIFVGGEDQCINNLIIIFFCCLFFLSKVTNSEIKFFKKSIDGNNSKKNLKKGEGYHGTTAVE